MKNSAKTGRISSYVLLCLAVGWSITTVWGQSDSLRTEIAQERISADSIRRTDPERNETEQKRLKELFRRSRQETTLFEIGMEYPLFSSGILWFNDPRPDIEQTTLTSLWAGVEHKLTPAWTVAGGVGWQFAPKTDKANVSGTSWLGQAGINFYPTITKAIREGRTANNFYHQFYVTGRALLPFHDQLKVNDSGPKRTINANAFQQATLLGVGMHSTRTRFYFYNVIIGAAYLFGRDEGIRHPVQLMWRISFGLGL